MDPELPALIESLRIHPTLIPANPNSPLPTDVAALEALNVQHEVYAQRAARTLHQAESRADHTRGIFKREGLILFDLERAYAAAEEIHKPRMAMRIALQNRIIAAAWDAFCTDVTRLPALSAARERAEAQASTVRHALLRARNAAAAHMLATARTAAHTLSVALTRTQICEIVRNVSLFPFLEEVPERNSDKSEEIAVWLEGVKEALEEEITVPSLIYDGDSD
jgi:hypothetical protein